MKQGRASMRISHTHPTPFNFFNEIGMGIILNKWGGLEMGVTCPKPTSLSCLLVIGMEIFMILYKTIL